MCESSIVLGHDCMHGWQHRFLWLRVCYHIMHACMLYQKLKFKRCALTYNLHYEWGYWQVFVQWECLSANLILNKIKPYLAYIITVHSLNSQTSDWRRSCRRTAKRPISWLDKSISCPILSWYFVAWIRLLSWPTSPKSPFQRGSHSSFLDQRTPWKTLFGNIRRLLERWLHCWMTR